MSRLLFAAARGARIQTNWQIDGWKDSPGLVHTADAKWQRIHPEDEHLQYGPISSALRMTAQDINGVVPMLNAPHIYAGVAFASETEAHEYDVADDLHRSLFLLILAEALADEGM